MKKTISFSVEIKPVAKERARAGKFGKFYTPAQTVAFEKLIKLHALQTCKAPLDGPVSVAVNFYVKSKNKTLWGTSKTTRPDLDNYIKACLDALNGVCFIDDGQVWSLYCTKTYSHEDRITFCISN